MAIERLEWDLCSSLPLREPREVIVPMNVGSRAMRNTSALFPTRDNPNSDESAVAKFDVNIPGSEM
jgi:hypothetical protein